MAVILLHFSTLFTIFALPNRKASSNTERYCQRLVPRSITSVITPCAFPCVLSHRDIIPVVVLYREVDGTPCQVGGTFLTQAQISTCKQGICQQPNSQAPLKRGKRGVASRNAARRGRKKGFGRFGRRMSKKSKKH
ncbi:uncharacterized protein LOC142576349 isoform X2 [Dermacentor variabilis]|uniref:uncharacterized protein LOC142576349 isoform X2 n=1 Tax=Dermacentor variabilis TaxID=34621 RepID=UPI003F5B631A